MFELSWIAITIAIFAVIYLLVITNQWRKRFAVQQQQILSLQHDLRSLCSAAVNVGERLGAIERESSQLSREQKILSQKQSQTTIKVATAEEPSFDQALKLAKKGASAEEIVDICNITRGEADLISMMYRLERAG